MIIYAVRCKGKGREKVTIGKKAKKGKEKKDLTKMKTPHVKNSYKM